MELGDLPRAGVEARQARGPDLQALGDQRQEHGRLLGRIPWPAGGERRDQLPAEDGRLGRIRRLARGARRQRRRGLGYVALACVGQLLAQDRHQMLRCGDGRLQSLAAPQPLYIPLNLRRHEALCPTRHGVGGMHRPGRDGAQHRAFGDPQQPRHLSTREIPGVPAACHAVCHAFLVRWSPCTIV